MKMRRSSMHARWAMAPIDSRTVRSTSCSPVQDRASLKTRSRRKARSTERLSCSAWSLAERPISNKLSTTTRASKRLKRSFTKARGPSPPSFTTSSRAKSEVSTMLLTSNALASAGGMSWCSAARSAVLSTISAVTTCVKAGWFSTRARTGMPPPSCVRASVAACCNVRRLLARVEGDSTASSSPARERAFSKLVKITARKRLQFPTRGCEASAFHHPGTPHVARRRT